MHLLITARALVSPHTFRLLLSEVREKLATLEQAWNGVLAGTHDAEIKCSTQRLSTGCFPRPWVVCSMHDTSTKHKVLEFAEMFHLQCTSQARRWFTSHARRFARQARRQPLERQRPGAHRLLKTNMLHRL